MVLCAIPNVRVVQYIHTGVGVFASTHNFGSNSLFCLSLQGKSRDIFCPANCAVRSVKCVGLGAHCAKRIHQWPTKCAACSVCSVHPRMNNKMWGVRCEVCCVHRALCNCASTIVLSSVQPAPPFCACAVNFAQTLLCSTLGLKMLKCSTRQSHFISYNKDCSHFHNCLILSEIGKETYELYISIQSKSFCENGSIQKVGGKC